MPKRAGRTSEPDDSRHDGDGEVSGLRFQSGLRETPNEPDESRHDDVEGWESCWVYYRQSRIIQSIALRRRKYGSNLALWPSPTLKTTIRYSAHPKHNH